MIQFQSLDFSNQNSSRKESFDSSISEGPTELLRTRVLDTVHLRFNSEAGTLIPLALRYVHTLHLNSKADTLIPLALRYVHTLHLYSETGTLIPLAFRFDHTLHLNSEADILIPLALRYVHTLHLNSGGHSDTTSIKVCSHSASQL